MTGTGRRRLRNKFQRLGIMDNEVPRDTIGIDPSNNAEDGTTLTVSGSDESEQLLLVVNGEPTSSSNQDEFNQVVDSVQPKWMQGRSDTTNLVEEDGNQELSSGLTRTDPPVQISVQRTGQQSPHRYASKSKNGGKESKPNSSKQQRYSFWTHASYQQPMVNVRIDLVISKKKESDR